MKKKSILVPAELHADLSDYKNEKLKNGETVTLWEIIESGLNCLKKNKA